MAEDRIEDNLSPVGRARGRGPGGHVGRDHSGHAVTQQFPRVGAELPSELPRGTVTFVFTDVEGSTALLKRVGDRYADLLEQHQLLLRTAFEAHGGREIDTQGESFFFAFARAREAVAAVVAGQSALTAHGWPDGCEVRVRMGVHTGEPTVGEQRYVGLGVHRAARISAVGHGRQVLLSNATRELVEDDLPVGVGLRDLGTFQLKDLDRPERIYQLDVDGLPAEFPPLNAPQVAEPHRLRRSGVLLAALAGVIAAAAAIPIFAFGEGGGNDNSLDTAAGNSVGIVDPDSNQLVADVAVGTTPTAVAAAAGAVWVTNAADGTVDRIDPATRTVRQTIRVGSGPIGIAFGGGSVWVANGLAGTVSRIDPGSNEVTQTVLVGNGPSGIAVGSEAVWVVNRDDHTLAKINVETGKVTRTFAAGAAPIGIAVGAGGVWVTNEAGGRVLRIDPRTGRVLDTVGVGRGPGAIAVTPGSVWVANSLDGTVSRIDPETSAVTATVRVGDGPTSIAAGGGSVWVANEFDGSISSIDPATNVLARSVSVGGRPSGIAMRPEGLFVAVRPAGGAHRGGRLTVTDVSSAFYKTIDPAASYSLQLSRLLSTTNDGLTAFKRVSGREGAELVPDLALSLPDPADAGRTYTFRLRAGIRYSTGTPLRAADVRHSLERVFELRSPAAYLFASIVGADACSRQPKQCDLSKGIVTDERARTVTFHLTKPDPELLPKLALPSAFIVPADTPSRDMGRRPLPATGPYRIAAHVPGRQIRLVRNPYFREWSHAARPAGYADEIVIRLGVPAREQIRATARGESDVADLTITGVDVAALRARYGARLHSSPGPTVVYTFLNTRLAPFDDVRVRRALNHALDREAVVRAEGLGPERAAATCQVLPQNYPGYEARCLYEHDLGKARSLVARSGTRGAPVVVWARASYKPFFSHVVKALRALGYRAELKLVADDAYYDAIRNEVDRIQAGFLAWGSDYPSAAGYVLPLLHVLGNASRFTDAAVWRQAARALQLQRTDPTGANELWAQVDRLIADRAPIVPMFNVRSLQVVSARVGNYQHHPLWDVLLDQLWVR
jgi:peptide/nickel transport system substrate-binding protein